MAINLTKGQSISLSKESPNLKKVLVGLGWDPIKNGGSGGGLFGALRGMVSGGSSADMDIDGSVICIGPNGRHEGTIYYGNLRHTSGAIRHYGDNLTGDGDGDDEQIEIDLSRVPSSIERLSIIVNIYSADSRGQDFSQVRNCFVHVDNIETGRELARYNVDGNFDGKTGIFVADLYRHNGEWKFKAIGEGVKVRDIGQMVGMKCH